MALYPPYWELNLEVTRLPVLYNLKRTPWDYIYGLTKGQVQGHIEDKRGQKEHLLTILLKVLGGLNLKKLLPLEI